MNQANSMPTEADMNAVKDIFSRMADSIVQASQLNNEVGDLRATVERLTRDFDNMIRRNQALDEALMQAQSDRNKVREELEQTKNSLTNALNERDRLDSLRLSDSDTIERLRNDLTQAKRDRDDASYRNLELTDKLAENDKRWDALRSIFQGNVTTPVPQEPPIGSGYQSAPDPWAETKTF